MNLRPYQQKAVEDIEATFASGVRSALYCLPTGGGKTVVFFEVARRLLERGGRCAILTHRVELAFQTAARLRAAGLDAGIFNADAKSFPPTPVTVAMWQTCHSRLKSGVQRWGNFDLLVFDEAHRAAADAVGETIRAFNPSCLLGVTATPQRSEGKGLKFLFDKLILGPTVQELIDMGYLCRYRCFAPTELVDRAALRVTAGEFVQSQAGAAAVKNMAKLVDNALKYFPDEKTAVVFCSDVSHAERAAAALRERGIGAETVHGGTDEQTRRTALRLLADKKIKFLTCCDVLTEGVDVPNVDGVVMARPTKSVVVYLQQVGRCLRPSPGKDEAVILDLVGNVYELGLPCEDRQWSLEPNPKAAKKSRAEAATVKKCRECFAVVPADADVCEACGSELASKRAAIREKEMVIREIVPRRENVELEKAKKALTLSYKEAVAFLDTYASLLIYAKLKGYKKGWAWYQAKDKGLIVPSGI